MSPDDGMKPEDDIQQAVAAYDRALARIAEDLHDGKLLERLEVAPIYPVFQVRS